jgi:hypothetical protein
MVSGVWTFRNSKGPQQNRANEHERGAHRQNIELHDEVHSFTSIQCDETTLAQNTVRQNKFISHCRGNLLHDTNISASTFPS